MDIYLPQEVFTLFMSICLNYFEYKINKPKDYSFALLEKIIDNYNYYANIICAFSSEASCMSVLSKK